MADVNELKMFYPSKSLVSDGGALTEFVADGGTKSTIVDTALTEADDFWNGAMLLFSGDTPTVALRGHTAHIKDFVAATDTLTISKELPAVVATGDKYTLILGGNFRSTKELLAQRASGQFPELVNLALTNITGVTLKYASPGLTALVVNWVQATSLLDIGGATFNVVGNSSNTLIFNSAITGWIVVDIVQASLPGTNQSDTLTLSRQTQTFNQDIEGFESTNALKGKTRYRLQVVKNEAGDTMNGLGVAFTGAGTATSAVAAGQSSGLGENSFNVDNGSVFPTSGFWLENTTKNDCRYVNSRSGNAMNVAATNKWTKFTITANNTVEPFPGNTITGPSGSGIIDAIRLHTGTWAAGTATATFYIKNLTGSFLNTHQIQISAVNIGLATANDVKGLRDKTGQTWVAADVVRLMASADLAIQAPTTNQFANPSNETLYPEQALNFTAPRGVVAEGVSIGALTAGSIYGVWLREWIVDDAKANSELIYDLEYSWS